ncbi:MAG: hypothetical protein K6B41_08510, partial [Butyrivibrio sp.]|nr:hypothetical protein [Butyrivibrio sp.]
MKKNFYWIAGLALLTAVFLVTFYSIKDTKKVSVQKNSEDYIVNASSDSLEKNSAKKISNNTMKTVEAKEETVEDTEKNGSEIFAYKKVKELEFTEAVLADDDIEGNFFDESGKDAVDKVSSDENSLPEKYDSRDVDGKSFVTGARDQGYTYLCWAYACAGAMESDLIIHNDEISADNINLSEKHLGYYNMHSATGSKNNLIDDDYRELVNRDNENNAWIFDYDTGYVSVGGVTDYCASILTAWKGPVADSGTDAFKTLYGMEAVFKDNADKPSDAYKCDYHVQGVYQIPCSMDNMEEVKQLIMEHGSVTGSINADDKFWRNNYTDLYDYESYGGDNIADHEILIVGWDDNYPKDNFVVSPPENGAFIARNSWGTAFGEAGFFYISYYDSIVTNNNIVAYHVASKGDDDYFDNNYQVDGFITNTVSALEDKKNIVYAEEANTNPYGVLYDVEDGAEVIKAVGLWSMETGQSFEVRIYKNPEVKDNKIFFDELEDAASTSVVKAATAGFHTFMLEDEVSMAKGDSFLCMVIPLNEGKLLYEKEIDFTGDANYDEWNNLTGNIHTHNTASKRSFYLSEDG